MATAADTGTFEALPPRRSGHLRSVQPEARADQVMRQMLGVLAWGKPPRSTVSWRQALLRFILTAIGFALLLYRWGP
jgi:hypothetical protein